MISFYSLAENDHHNHDHSHDQTNEESSKKDKKSLGAHVHGVSNLNVVQDMKQLSFEFEMPGFDVVGFEYKAKKKEDIKKVRNALNILSDYKNMINVTASANCKKEKSSAKVINEGSHSEFISQYLLICEKISSIKNIKIKYFDSFPFSKELKINLIAKNKKITKTINKQDSIISVDEYFN
jgi:hypothetical protein